VPRVSRGAPRTGGLGEWGAISLPLKIDSEGIATYLYQDGPRYWYSTQPTVTKLAEDRAELLKRDPDKVAQELDRRLRDDLRRPSGRLRLTTAAR
jgi:hypothetical protein